MSDAGSENTNTGQPIGGPSVRTERGEPLFRVAYAQDQVIFPEGGDSTDAFVVESGTVGIFKTVEGRLVRLGVLEKGAVFGEMAAVTGAQRSATAMALEPCVVVRISRAIVQNRLATCDPFIKAMIHILINNLGRVNERFAVHHQLADQLLHDLKASADMAADKIDAVA